MTAPLAVESKKKSLAAATTILCRSLAGTAAIITAVSACELWLAAKITGPSRRSSASAPTTLGGANHRVAGMVTKSVTAARNNLAGYFLVQAVS